MQKYGKADIIIGTQYGDEGKARVIDDIAENYDVIARFNGGANAGHTIENQGVRVALKQVPSGIFHNDKILYIGSGCVINIAKLASEIRSLEKIGINLADRLRISSQAGVVQPHHILVDTLIGEGVGTTKNGIGPAYADRALRMWGDRLLNIRLGDLLENSEKYYSLIKENLDFTKQVYNFKNSENMLDLDALKKQFEEISSFIETDTLFIQKRIENGKNIIFEGAQSFMLDVNKGSVPYVTSSHTCASSAYVGGDLPPNFHHETIGVAKAIMSRVGHGPFISEFGNAKSEEYCMSENQDGSPKYGKSIEDQYDIEKLISSTDAFEMSKAIRSLSGEYGTVTSRPRRVGALDLPQLSYAVKANGIKKIVLTKCDLLQIYSRSANGTIPIVTKYKLDGELIDFVPGSTETYQRVQPIIEERPCFKQDISNAKTKSDLPKELISLLSEIEGVTNCSIVGIGVGPSRDQYIKVD